ncbi:serine palmitoyltransferase small subunit B [Stomoxys calcitrans]|uniref:serine palmitoyltransferase small subunit B n=1 Tax=Stomoxys calcitrans TaxID=35570 RepID=UPI0027E2366E|nr:serine palmitoyltransferase small subunit B [Stomoxys calcitrans]
MLNTIKKSFERFIGYIKWLHMLYELNTYLSMCEPWEKVFLNCLFAVTISIIAYSTLVYIPPYLYTLITYINPGAAAITFSDPLIMAGETEL